MRPIRVFLLALTALLLLPTAVRAQAPSAFAYQGVLDDGGSPASGSYDFRFLLFDQVSNGTQVGSTVTQLGIPADAGLFSTRLDFGADVWTGAERYLDVRVRPAGGGSYTTVGSRTRILSAPYAITAGSVTVPLELSATVDGGNAGVVTITNTGSGDGLRIEDAGSDGVSVTTSQTGVYVQSANGTGVLVNSADGAGLVVGSAGSDGVQVSLAGDDGLSIGSAGDDGVEVFSAGGYGIYASGSQGGAYLRQHTSAATRSPDIILGGTTSSTAAGDNAVLTTDPAYSGSDLFLTSNDAVIIDLDLDGDETGELQVIGNSGAVVFQVLDTGTAALAGTLEVAGTVTGGAGASRIDHPLDPEGRVLQHAFVGSPEMMSIYNGTITLDAAGEATVALPDYVEALGRDFRYQLTCLGGFAPVYIAEEVQDGRFHIAGGTAGLRVSWQVTGVRQDAWAEANRLVVEEAKPAEQQGRYLHPEAFNQPADMAVSTAETDGPSQSVDQALLDAREAEELEAERARMEEVRTHRESARTRHEAEQPADRPSPRPTAHDQ